MFEVISVVSMLKFAKEDLEKMRDTTHQPKLLEWQVRLYDHCILGGEDLASEYFIAKNSGGSRPHRERLEAAAKAVGFAESIPEQEHR